MKFLEASKLCRIFRLRVEQLIGGPIFKGRNEITRLRKALKLGVMFQNYALKLIKIWKVIEEIREKMDFSKSF